MSGRMHGCSGYNFKSFFFLCHVYSSSLSVKSRFHAFFHPICLFLIQIYLDYIMIRTFGAYRCFATIMIQFAVRQSCKHVGFLALIISRFCQVEYLYFLISSVKWKRGYPGKGQPLQPNFTNTTHFYKCFKEHYHMTPKQFKNK